MLWNTSFFQDTLNIETITNLKTKQELSERVAERVKNGEVIGFGSGSTSYLTVLAIAERIQRHGWHVTAIPTSHEIEWLCHRVGIPTASLTTHRPDWGFDGADELTKDGMMIKGRGGALLREKLVMAASPYTYILVDETKNVSRLGEKTPVPVEIIPESLSLVQHLLQETFNHRLEQVTTRLAKGKDGPIITEKGNLLLDVKLTHVQKEDMHLFKQVTGVVESGLFVDFPIRTL